MSANFSSHKRITVLNFQRILHSLNIYRHNELSEYVWVDAHLFFFRKDLLSSLWVTKRLRVYVPAPLALKKIVRKNQRIVSFFVVTCYKAKERIFAILNMVSLRNFPSCCRYYFLITFVFSTSDAPHFEHQQLNSSWFFGIFTIRIHHTPAAFHNFYRKTASFGLIYFSLSFSLVLTLHFLRLCSFLAIRSHPLAWYLQKVPLSLYILFTYVARKIFFFSFIFFLFLVCSSFVCVAHIILILWVWFALPLPPLSVCGCTAVDYIIMKIVYAMSEY